MTKAPATFPVPGAWTSGWSRGDRGTAIVYGVLTSLLCVFAVAALRGNQFEGLISVSLVAVGLVLELAILARSVRRRRVSCHVVRTESVVRLRERMLILRRDSRTRVYDFASAVACGAGFVIFANAVWSDRLDIPLPSARMDLYPPIALVLGVAFIGRAVRVARTDDCGFGLAAEGIRFSSRRGVEFWESVGEVEPSPAKGDRRLGAWLSLAPGDRQHQIRVDQTALGASATLWLLDFYWRHPELRTELGSTAAIRRLRDGLVVEDRSRHV